MAKGALQSTADPQPTSGADWRKPREEGYLLTLPSGYVARLRPPALHDMMAQGEIPAPLVNMAAEVIWEGDLEAIGELLTEAEKNEQKRAKIHKTVPDFIKLARIVCRAAFVSPRIVDEPKADDEISIKDLDEGDIFYVWRTATKGASTLAFFRDQQVANVEAVHDLHGEGDGAEPDDAD